MAAISVGELEAILRLRDELSPSLKLVDQHLSKTGALLQSTGGQIKSVGANLAPLSAGIVAVGFGATSMATTLNESLANVSALLTDLSGSQLDKVVGEMKGKVQGMSVDMGKSTTDISGGLYEVISSLGLTNDTFGQLEISAKAGAAGLASTQESFNFLSAVTKTYGDTSESAFKKAADLGFQAVNFGQTTFPQLAASIGGVAPLAKVAGVSMEEMFAVIATATGVTGNTAEVTTQMTSAINGLLNPSKEMTALYVDLGVESGQALIQQRGFVGALQAVAKSSEETKVPMTDLLGRKEAFILTASLAGSQAQKFAQNLDHMGKAAGANGGIIDEAFKKQTQGVNAAGFAWKQFKADLEVTMQQIGDALIPILSRAGAQLKPLWDGVKTAVDWFTKLPQPVQTSVVAFAALLALLAPIAYAIGTMVAMLGGLSLAFGGAAGTSAFLTLSLTGLEARLLALGTGNGLAATAAVKMLTAAYGVQILAANATSTALTFYRGVALATQLNLATLSAQLGITTAGQYASAVASGAAAAAKGLLAAAINLVAGSSLAMGVRMAAGTVATYAAAAAAAAGSVAMGVLGTAILAVQYAALPLIAAFAGWKLGPMIGDWLGFSDAIERTSLRFQRFLGLIPKATTDQDIYNAVAANTARRSGEAGKGLDEAAAAAARLKDQISGAALMKEMNALQAGVLDLTKSGPLSALAIQQIATAATNLQAQGVKLTPALKNVIAQFDAMGKTADVNAGKSKSMTTALGETQKAIASLTKEQQRQIQAGDKMGMSADEIVVAMKKLFPTLNLTEKAVGMYTDRLDKSRQTMKEFWSEADKLGKQQLDIEAVLGQVETRAGSYAMEMAATKSAVARLTVEQKANILTGLQLGDSVEDVARVMKVSADAVKLYKDETEKATAKTKAFWEESDKLGKQQLDLDAVLGKIEHNAGTYKMMLEATRAEVKGLSDEQRQNVIAGLAMGDSTKEIAEALHISEAAVKSFSDNAKTGLSDVADAFVRLGQAAGGNLGNWLSSAGQIIVQLDSAEKSNKKWNGEMGVANALFAKGSTGAEKFASAIATIAVVAQGVQSVLAATGKETDKFGNAMNGAMAGAQAGAAFGPWGMAIGAVAGGLVGLFRAGSNARKEMAALNAEVLKSTTAFRDAHKSMTDVDAVAAHLGIAFNWAPKTKADLDALNAAFKEFDARLATTNATFDTLLGNAKELGIGLPQALQDSIQHLVDIGLLTDDVAAKFLGLTPPGTVEWEQMQAAAEKYGIDVDALGPKFQGLKIHDAAVEIINDLDLLARGGADIGGALFGAREELSGLVNEAIRTGSEIPENMRPYVDELMRSGNLLSENRIKANDMAAEILKMGELPAGLAPMLQSFIQTGDLIDTNTGKSITFEQMVERFGGTGSDAFKKILKEMGLMGEGLGENQGELTDLSALKFGDPVQTQFEKITLALQDVVTNLGNIASAISGIPTGKTVTIRTDYVDEGPPPGWGDVNVGDRRSDENGGFAAGTKGATGSWFADFGGGTTTTLHGREAVVREDQAEAFAAAHGARGGNANDARLAGIERLLRDQPRAIALAIQNAVALGGRV